MDQLSIERIELFKSLFKGREDVFAIRWEKEGKAGYTPAYDLNWNDYSLHKNAGGTFKDFKDKKYSKLTNERIANHLCGKEVIGIYPLLMDNSSWFIVADFDENISIKRSWQEECKTFIKACSRANFPVYLERSRSGKGGHVWMFFEQNYPSYKSRKIFLHLLESVGIISAFDKNSNYDRLFPNQDYHSGKGMGNLVALPFQLKALTNSNSCFIEPESSLIIPDQWNYLESVKKVAIRQLDEFFYSISNSPFGNASFQQPDHPGSIDVILNNYVVIPRIHLKPDLVIFLRENLNFVNSEYIIKKKLGKKTYGIEPYFKMLDEENDLLYMPRGFIGKLLRYFTKQNISYHLIDQRKKVEEVNFSFKTSLFEYQQRGLEAMQKKDFGIIVAPSGSGKTVIGLGLVAQKKQPALIIVHRKILFDQWIERIQSFLGIGSPFIGKIAGGQVKIGTHITVAMIQSIQFEPGDPFFQSFGTIVIDECHHIPARTFREVIKNFNSFYLYGLTATPTRKNNDEKLIFFHIGDIIHEVKYPTENIKHSQKMSIVIRETALMVPFEFKTDSPEIISQILIHDSGRNQMIVEDVISEVNKGRKVLILTERKAHIDVLQQYLKNNYEVITVSGQDVEFTRKQKLKQISDGNFQIIISTGQFFGEGSDFTRLDCLVLAYPFSFEGKLAQYIGRVQRSERAPIIYDFRDIHINYLERMFRLRNSYYRKLTNTKPIEKFDDLVLHFNGDRVSINSNENYISILNLDLPSEVERFREGISWKVRVLNYDEEEGELTLDILDYNCNSQQPASLQKSLQFISVEKIKFRNIDTGNFLRSVELKKVILNDIGQSNILEESIQQFIEPVIEKRRILRRTMKVPFYKIQFQYASVSFSLFIEEVGMEVKFEIDNPDIRPEFDVLKEYFAKVLKKKLIVTDIEITYVDEGIISAKAWSEDIQRINNSIIDNVRFEFVKKEVVSFKGQGQGGVLNTLDDLFSHIPNSQDIKLYKSEQEFIDGILNAKSSRHYYQLKYLAGRHQYTILKVRFILNPFSFIFLLAGDKKYHIIWETLNTEEASYIWHFDKSMESLRKGLMEIEQSLNKIKATNKQVFLKDVNTNFSRIIHDYNDAKKGFVQWKDALEEILV